MADERHELAAQDDGRGADEPPRLSGEKAAKPTAARSKGRLTKESILPQESFTKAPKISAKSRTREEENELKRVRREAQRAAQRRRTPPKGPLGRWWRRVQSSPDRISLGMCIVALGVVYGDIGTSPLYTMQAFVAGQGGMARVDRAAVLGMLSLVFWSITLITTVKYVLVAMRIDNKGEGGIFALYTLVRHYGKWLAIPAMVGGAAFLADSVLTPAVSISSAVEGLKTIPVLTPIFRENGNLTMVITFVIILHRQRLVHLRGPESGLRDSLPLQPAESGGPDHHGHRLPVDHGSRGTLLRHGPRGPRQHLRHLALHQRRPGLQLLRPGGLDPAQQRQ